MSTCGGRTKRGKDFVGRSCYDKVRYEDPSEEKKNKEMCMMRGESQEKERKGGLIPERGKRKRRSLGRARDAKHISRKKDADRKGGKFKICWHERRRCGGKRRPRGQKNARGYLSNGRLKRGREKQN